jgi:hypothetical protein
MAVLCMCIGLCLTAELFRLAAGYLGLFQVTRRRPARQGDHYQPQPNSGYAPKTTPQNAGLAVDSGRRPWELAQDSVNVDSKKP